MIHPTYHNGTYQHTGNGRDTHVRTPRTLSNHHRHMLEMESGISPDKIAGRGYWTATTAAEIPPGFDWYQCQPEMFPILVTPQWNLAGRMSGYTLRPDNPRRDKEGKIVKYEDMPGAPVGFDCPPSMVHLLRDPSVPLYITEGSKKADAMASRGLPCISLNGVYGFMSKKVIISELDEIDCEGRPVRLIFDDDIMTKPGPADALNRLAGAIDRRHGRVGRVLLRDPQHPDARPGAAKIGADDFFVRGGTPADLDALTTPWAAVRRPRNLIDYADPYAEIERLRADNATLVKLIKNPHIKEKQKIAIMSLTSLAMSKASRGEVDELGRVQESSREIANDWRDRKEKGTRAESVNPEDGSVPLMGCDSVHGLFKELRDDLKVFDFTPTRVKKTRKSTGVPYWDTEFLIPPPASIAEALGPLATYAPDAPKVRPYNRQDPCPACNEVHERTVIRQMACGSEDDPGCGAIVKETRLTLPVPPADDPDATEEQRAELDRRTAAPAMADEHIDFEAGEVLDAAPIAGNFPTMDTVSLVSPLSPPVNYSAGNFPTMDDELELVASEPPGLWDVPPVEDADPNDPNDLPFNVCVDCGTPVLTGRMWPRCGPCIEAAREQAEADLARDRAERAARLGMAS